MILDRFEPLDQQLLQALQVDGRASFRALGEVLGVSDQTVARCCARLRSAGRARVLGLTDPLRLREVSWVLRLRARPPTPPCRWRRRWPGARTPPGST